MDMEMPSEVILRKLRLVTEDTGEASNRDTAMKCLLAFEEVVYD